MEITDTVDLSDEEGAVKNIHKNLLDYGTRYFEDRESLILLRVESKCATEFSVYGKIFSNYFSRPDKHTEIFETVRKNFHFWLAPVLLCEQKFGYI